MAPATATLEKLRQSGFETIRLPVNGDLISAADPVGLGRIHDGVAELVRLGFAVLVDMHPSADLHAAFERDPAAASDRVVQAWTALRPVIADLPAASVYPELLNEPPMERAVWLALRGRLAETLRATCPQHTLVWGPARFQGIWEIADTPPLADDNQIAAIHFYAPMAFTHQCRDLGYVAARAHCQPALSRDNSDPGGPRPHRKTARSRRRRGRLPGRGRTLEPVDRGRDRVELCRSRALVGGA